MAKFELCERLGLKIETFHFIPKDYYVHAADLEALLQKSVCQDGGLSTQQIVINLKPKDERVSREEIEALKTAPFRNSKSEAESLWHLLERILKHGVRE